MKKINVTIKGVAPLLHNRFVSEEHGVESSRAKKKVYNPEQECEKACYRDKETKDLMQPAEHIMGALIKAGVSFKFEGKKTYKDIIKGGVIIEPEMIPLGKENWDEIDARPVVIQRARVMKWRPKFNDWEVSFEVTIIDDENLSVSTLKEIFDKAGYIGIGDYRPRFGRFQVVEFKEIK